MNKLKIAVLVTALATTMRLEVGELALASTTSPQDVSCLAKNIYHEARGESIEGQVAVAQVTINRLRAGEFGSSICRVVYAHKQFSWTLDKKKKIKDDKAWEISKTVANEVLKGKARLPNFNALYFHTKQVRPKWRREKQIVTTIGNHIFYT